MCVHAHVSISCYSWSGNIRHSPTWRTVMCKHRHAHIPLCCVCVFVCVCVHLPSVRDDALSNGRWNGVIQDQHRAACSQARVRAHHEGKHKWLQQAAGIRKGKRCLKCAEHFRHTGAVCVYVHANVIREGMRDCVFQSVCLLSLSDFSLSLSHSLALSLFLCL